MLPKLLDISNEKCRGTLRRLELEAYSNVISVFRAQGNLTEKKSKILDDLRNVFSIASDRHRAEVRRANSDELLCTISEKLFRNGSQIEWMKEGRRAFPLLPRSHPLTALSHIATEMSRQAYRENVKLAREEALAKVKLAAIERAAAERAAEIEKTKNTCTIVSSEQTQQNDNEIICEDNEIKIEPSNEIESGLEISKQGDVKLTEEDMLKVNYLELKELLKLSTTITTKSKTSKRKPIKNHNSNKQNHVNNNIIKRKLKHKKEKKLNEINATEEKQTENEINIEKVENDNQKEEEFKEENKLHKKRKKRSTHKKKLDDADQTEVNLKLNNKELNDTIKTDTSNITTNIPPTINYDKINQMPVQKCILNIDLKPTTTTTTTTTPTLPVATPITIMSEQQQNYLKRPSIQPIQTVLEAKRINLSDAKILKIDNFNPNPPTSQSKTNIICLNQIQKLDNSDAINHSKPVNIQKVSPIIMSNIKINTNNLKPTSGIQQRKRVNLMTSSNGKVFIRPVDEKNSSILSLPIATTANTLNKISANVNLNLPTINLTKVSVLDNKTFQPQQLQQSNQIKGNQSMEYYTTPTTNTLNKNYQVIQLPPKHNLSLDKSVTMNSNNNIFIIGSIQTDLKLKYDKLEKPDIKNKPIIKIENKMNSADLITEDTPVDIVNENLLQYNDNLIVEDDQDDVDYNKTTNSLNNNVNKISNNNINNGNNNSNINDSNNNDNINNNEKHFYKNYGEPSTGSIILETQKKKINNCVDNVNIKTKISDQLKHTTTTQLQNNEVDWELELDQQAQKTNHEYINNNGILNSYTNNCIIYKNINNYEKTSNSFNDYIEEIVEEAISDDESGNAINNGYYNFQEEEEECIDVDDSTINLIKN